MRAEKTVEPNPIAAHRFGMGESAVSLADGRDGARIATDLESLNEGC
jgi:hypothetical protein